MGGKRTSLGMDMGGKVLIGVWVSDHCMELEFDEGAINRINKVGYAVLGLYWLYMLLRGGH